jgi:hypothetical protein
LIGSRIAAAAAVRDLDDRFWHIADVAAVIASAVIPTLIANAFFLPRHLLPKHAEAVQEDA